MHRFLFLTVSLFMSAIFVAAQRPVASPTPVRTPDEDVVKISTNLIQVDVTVTDKSGNVVRNLTAGDFEIYENGKNQPISNFTFISNSREIERPQKPAVNNQAVLL